MNLGIGLAITRAGQTISFSPDSLRVGTRVVQDLTFDPSRLFSDVAGTTLIAGPGAEVAAQKDSRGVIVRIQPTLAARLKYALEPASGVRNRFLNSRGGGATLGVIGSGGVLPTGWTLTNAPGAEIIGQGFEGDFPYIDIELALTPTNSINLSFQDGVPAVVGEVWTQSFSVRRIAGSDTNIVRHRNLVVEFNGVTFVVQQETDITASVATGARVETTRTLTGAATTNVRGSYGIVWTAGAINIRLRVKWAQMERAAAMTAVQTTGADGFDVTEPGVRSVHALAYDRVDDWMQLSAAFQPAGGYTLAAAVDIGGGAQASMFGASGSSDVRFIREASGGLEAWADGASNRSTFAAGEFPGAVTGRSVNIARVSGTGLADAWVNGFGPLAGTLTGAMTPMDAAGINAVGRFGSSFLAARREYGSVLIDPGNTPVTDAEITLLRRHLAQAGGITL